MKTLLTLLSLLFYINSVNALTFTEGVDYSLTQDVVSLDDFSNTDQVTFVGGTVYDTSIRNVTSRPTGSEGTYWTMSLGNAGHIQFSTPISYLGFLWGSVDRYNHLVINTSSGTHSFWGTDLTNFGTNTTTYVNFYDDEITSVDFYSCNGCTAFEVDNFSYSVTAVPEPGTNLMFLGALMMGFIVHRRTKLPK
jgi:hypothetical protein